LWERDEDIKKEKRKKEEKRGTVYMVLQILRKLITKINLNNIIIYIILKNKKYK